MNYRHVFHAGNFADFMKHAMLLNIVGALTREASALTVVETHAGAGIYDLQGTAALRTGEAAGGVLALMAADAPEAFATLKAAVRAANRGEEIRYYPGSPLLIADALRSKDRLVACELREDDCAALEAALPKRASIKVVRQDGWQVARAEARGANRLLLHVDPPFELTDDTVQAAALTGEILRGAPDAVLMLWAPIKDLDGFDGVVGRMQDAAGSAPLLVAQARVRPLTNPMRMNGSALIVVNPTTGLHEAADGIARWIADRCGELGALGRAELM